MINVYPLNVTSKSVWTETLSPSWLQLICLDTVVRRSIWNNEPLSDLSKFYNRDDTGDSDDKHIAVMIS